MNITPLRSRARSLAATAVLVTAATALIASTAAATETTPTSAPSATVTDASEVATPAAVTGGPSTSKRALAQARAATAKYHDVDVAYADGYEAVSPCVEAPGLGVMGVHLLNHDRVVDGVLDPRAPEALLYLPTDDGLQLIGVEYFQPDADQDLTTDDDRPSLFGVPFDGPMEGHGPGEPVHFDLHVWLWKHNPAGMTAPFNPSLSCDAGTADAN